MILERNLLGPGEAEKIYGRPCVCRGLSTRAWEREYPRPCRGKPAGLPGTCGPGWHLLGRHFGGDRTDSIRAYEFMLLVGVGGRNTARGLRSGCVSEPARCYWGHQRRAPLGGYRGAHYQRGEVVEARARVVYY